MTTQTITTGSHTALFDPTSETGILIAPNPEDDMHLNGPVSLHAADWDSLTRRLVKAGWAIVEDEWEIPEVVTHLPSGEKVYALFPRPIEVGDLSEDLTNDEDFVIAIGRLLDAYTKRSVE